MSRRGVILGLSLIAACGGDDEVDSRPTRTITVTVDDPQLGRVSSNPAGIDCPDACQLTTSAPVGLIAIPAFDGMFEGWSGGCQATNAAPMRATIPADSGDVSCSARFTPLLATIEVSVIGPGSVTIDDGEPCESGDTCQSSFLIGTDLLLFARPGPGASFVGWTGELTSTATVTNFDIPRGHTQLTATFDGPDCGSPPIGVPSVSVIQAGRAVSPNDWERIRYDQGFTLRALAQFPPIGATWTYGDAMDPQDRITATGERLLFQSGYDAQLGNNPDPLEQPGLMRGIRYEVSVTIYPEACGPMSDAATRIAPFFIAVE